MTRAKDDSNSSDVNLIELLSSDDEIEVLDDGESSSALEDNHVPVPSVRPEATCDRSSKPSKENVYKRPSPRKRGGGPRKKVRLSSEVAEAPDVETIDISTDESSRSPLKIQEVFSCAKPSGRPRNLRKSESVSISKKSSPKTVPLDLNSLKKTSALSVGRGPLADRIAAKNPPPKLAADVLSMLRPGIELSKVWKEGDRQFLKKVSKPTTSGTVYGKPANYEEIETIDIDEDESNDAIDSCNLQISSVFSVDKDGPSGSGLMEICVNEISKESDDEIQEIDLSAEDTPIKGAVKSPTVKKKRTPSKEHTPAKARTPSKVTGTNSAKKKIISGPKNVRKKIISSPEKLPSQGNKTKKSPKIRRSSSKNEESSVSEKITAALDAKKQIHSSPSNTEKRVRKNLSTNSTSTAKIPENSDIIELGDSDQEDNPLAIGDDKEKVEDGYEIKIIAEEDSNSREDKPQEERNSQGDSNSGLELVISEVVGNVEENSGDGLGLVITEVVGNEEKESDDIEMVDLEDSAGSTDVADSCKKRGCDNERRKGASEKKSKDEERSKESISTNSKVIDESSNEVEEMETVSDDEPSDLLQPVCKEKGRSISESSSKENVADASSECEALKSSSKEKTVSEEEDRVGSSEETRSERTSPERSEEAEREGKQEASKEEQEADASVQVVSPEESRNCEKSEIKGANKNSEKEKEAISEQSEDSGTSKKSKKQEILDEQKAGSSKAKESSESSSRKDENSVETSQPSSPKSGSSSTKSESDTEESYDSKTLKKIKFLEKLCEKCEKMIGKYETAELNDDDMDDENSAYVMVDRYKKRYVEVWRKLCELKGGDPDLCKTSKRIKVFEGSSYPEINSSILKRLNLRQDYFPDYTDILEVIQNVNVKKNLHMTEITIEAEARETFQAVVKALKKKREKTFLYLFGSKETDDRNWEADPSASDSALSEKLKENEGNAEAEIDKIINKYATQQETQPTQDEEEGDKSDTKGEDSESDDESIHIEDGLDEPESGCSSSTDS